MRARFTVLALEESRSDAAREFPDRARERSAARDVRSIDPVRG